MGGYSGSHCETRIPGACVVESGGAAGTIDCKNGGVSTGTMGQCACKCGVGWSGTKCETALQCTAGANGQPCQHGSTAVGNTGSCNCECSLGYSGSNCETADCTHGLNGKPCENGGSPTGTIECSCQCAAGYSGANCEIAASCTVSSGGGAGTIDCKNKGSATGRTGACQCACTDTWSGMLCETAKVEPCDLVPCKNSGKCSVSSASDSSFQCDCSSTGYQGTTCELDPCKKITCLNGGTCLEGSCSCPPGFKGDTCSDVVTKPSYFWKITQFNGCSAGCGGGTQSRDVTCWEKKDAKVILATDNLCAADKKPLLEQACNDIKCGENVATVTFRLDLNFDDVTASAEIEESFRQTLARDISTAIDIEKERIRIDSLAKGSVVVQFSILPASDGSLSSMSVADAMSKFETEMKSETSWIRTNSQVVSTSKTPVAVVSSGIKTSTTAPDPDNAGSATNPTTSGNDVNQQDNDDQAMDAGGIIGIILGGMFMCFLGSAVVFVLFAPLCFKKRKRNVVDGDSDGDSESDANCDHFQRRGSFTVKNPLELELGVVNPPEVKDDGDEEEEERIPELHEIMRSLKMTAWTDKLVLLGIHNTEMLLALTESDLMEVGMRTLHRNRLLKKLNKIRTMGASAAGENVNVEEEEQEYAKQVLSKGKSRRMSTRGQWKRRFSVNSDRSFYEDTETGATQFAAPVVFGEDEESPSGVTDAGDVKFFTISDQKMTGRSSEEASLSEMLESVRLSKFTRSMEIAGFEALSDVTTEWIEQESNMSTLQQRRMHELLARETGNLWYIGMQRNFDGTTTKCYVNVSSGQVLEEHPDYCIQHHEDAWYPHSFVKPAPKSFFDARMNKLAETESPIHAWLCSTFDLNMCILYGNRLVADGYDDLDALFEMTDGELSELDVKGGHRKKILKACEAAKAAAAKNSQKNPVGDE